MRTGEVSGILAHPASADRTLPDGMPLDYILDVEWVCNGFLEEQGEPRREHAPADLFTLDDLIDMYEFAECPLHLNPEYPLVPEGLWKRQLYHASLELDRLTEARGHETSRDGKSHWTVTPQELRALWERFPHARWAYEKHAESGDLFIEVVDE